ncbi:MAG: sugar phosphate isomerase/epimerase family protein [Isosphaeraceae bacterium]
MRLSFYTYSYTDRLNLPVVACLERIAAAGYSGIDVSGTHGASDDPRSFDAERRTLTRRTAQRLGLRIEAVVTHATLTDTLADPDRPDLDLVGTIDLAVALGATVVTFHMGGEHPGIGRDELWAKVVKAVAEAADHGAARHVALAVDGIWPTWLVRDADSLARLFDDVGSVNFGVNFDPCYLTLIGVDLNAFLGRFASRAVHAHLKDHRGTYPRWEHKVPGQGSMNYENVFRIMDKSGFKGSAAVECFTDMPFEETCDAGSKDMRDAARRAGVEFER